ncbi:hypothetical protein BT63DRAFT_470374 [Microthyrium microscopicum]|uniref:Uncharacterized protein n=1 Tax=Microthyrium microscopicum TaxID=703497 RepID=A0A6A6U9H9_9PEZI|nr:hypothetical protein BT63DRAFT_470374 [Microthyrium microscopicum]
MPQLASKEQSTGARIWISLTRKDNGNLLFSYSQNPFATSSSSAARENKMPPHSITYKDPEQGSGHKMKSLKRTKYNLHPFNFRPSSSQRDRYDTPERATTIAPAIENPPFSPLTPTETAIIPAFDPRISIADILAETLSDRAPAPVVPPHTMAPTRAAVPLKIQVSPEAVIPAKRKAPSAESDSLLMPVEQLMKEVQIAVKKRDEAAATKRAAEERIRCLGVALKAHKESLHMAQRQLDQKQLTLAEIEVCLDNSCDRDSEI